jgi:hypothetical protein
LRCRLKDDAVLDHGNIQKSDGTIPEAFSQGKIMQSWSLVMLMKDKVASVLFADLNHVVIYFMLFHKW